MAMFTDEELALLTARHDALDANLDEFRAELKERGLDDCGPEYVKFAKKFADQKRQAKSKPKGIALGCATT